MCSLEWSRTIQYSKRGRAEVVTELLMVALTGRSMKCVPSVVQWYCTVPNTVRDTEYETMKALRGFCCHGEGWRMGFVIVTAV